MERIDVANQAERVPVELFGIAAGQYGSHFVLPGTRLGICRKLVALSLKGAFR